MANAVVMGKEFKDERFRVRYKTPALFCALLNDADALQCPQRVMHCSNVSVRPASPTLGARE